MVAVGLLRSRLLLQATRLLLLPAFLLLSRVAVGKWRRALAVWDSILTFLVAAILGLGTCWAVAMRAARDDAWPTVFAAVIVGVILLVGLCVLAVRRGSKAKTVVAGR